MEERKFNCFLPNTERDDTLSHRIEGWPRGDPGATCSTIDSALKTFSNGFFLPSFPMLREASEAIEETIFVLNKLLDYYLLLPLLWRNGSSFVSNFVLETMKHVFFLLLTSRLCLWIKVWTNRTFWLLFDMVTIPPPSRVDCSLLSFFATAMILEYNQVSLTILLGTIERSLRLLWLFFFFFFQLYCIFLSPGIDGITIKWAICSISRKSKSGFQHMRGFSFLSSPLVHPFLGGTIPSHHLVPSRRQSPKRAFHFKWDVGTSDIESSGRQEVEVLHH